MNTDEELGTTTVLLWYYYGTNGTTVLLVYYYDTCLLWYYYCHSWVGSVALSPYVPRAGPPTKPLSPQHGG